MAPQVQTNTDQHPFGGCNRLFNQYTTIGAELLRYEEATKGYGHAEDALTGFRQGVSFIGVEVLESYLEDLLNLEHREQTLYIYREGINFRLTYTYIALFGLLFAIGMGIYATSAGATFFLSFALTLSLALPFAILWHLAPRAGLARRMAFAQVLSHEIARRRGGDKDVEPATITLGKLLGQKTAQSAQGAAFTLLN